MSASLWSALSAISRCQKSENPRHHENRGIISHTLKMGGSRLAGNDSDAGFESRRLHRTASSLGLHIKPGKQGLERLGRESERDWPLLRR
jgi:hypothetical protein